MKRLEGRFDLLLSKMVRGEEKPVKAGQTSSAAASASCGETPVLGSKRDKRPSGVRGYFAP